MRRLASAVVAGAFISVVPVRAQQPGAAEEQAVDATAIMDFDAQRGKAVAVRMVTRIRDADHHEFEYWVRSSGHEEHLAMACEYVRERRVSGQ